MYKNLIILLFITTSLFSDTTVRNSDFFVINCPGSIVYTSLSQITNNDMVHGTYRPEEELDYRENSSSYSIDNNFVGCGGSSLEFKHFGVSNGSYGETLTFTPTTSEANEVWAINSEGAITNKVIFINGLPCLSYPRKTLSNYVKDYDSNQFWDGTFTLISPSDFYTPNNWSVAKSEDAEILKSVCGDFPSGEKIDYTSYLNEIIDNTSSIDNILDSVNNFFSSETAKETSLSDLGNNFDFNQSDEAVSSSVDGFNDDIVSYATSSFEDNKEIINLSGCSAPAPIRATVFGKSYTFFDIATLTDDNVQLIRNIFLLSGYLAGFIVVFRTI